MCPSSLVWLKAGVNSALGWCSTTVFCSPLSSTVPRFPCAEFRRGAPAQTSNTILIRQNEMILENLPVSGISMITRITPDTAILCSLWSRILRARIRMIGTQCPTPWVELFPPLVPLQGTLPLPSTPHLTVPTPTILPTPHRILTNPTPNFLNPLQLYPMTPMMENVPHLHIITISRVWGPKVWTTVRTLIA